MSTTYVIHGKSYAKKSDARAAYYELYRRGVSPTVKRVVTTDCTLEWREMQEQANAEFIARWPGGEEQARRLVAGERS